MKWLFNKQYQCGFGQFFLRILNHDGFFFLLTRIREQSSTFYILEFQMYYFLD